MPTACTSRAASAWRGAAAAGLLLLAGCAAQQPPAPAKPAPPPAAVPPAEAPALSGRLLADAHEYPWSALVRVNLAGHGFCTGVLIGPRQVLTQARCLWFEREARWFQPFELHVIAGYQRDRFIADSRLADFTVAPGYNPHAGSSLANLASNWALITLEAPIGRKAGWVGLQWDSTADHLRAGYRQDRPHAVSVHFGCSAESDSAARLCQATPTELALPPFVIEAGELRVLADFYAATPDRARPLARLTGSPLGDKRMGAAQPPAAGGPAGREPTATAATLLAALGYDVSGGRLGAAAAAFRRDNGLPASESIDLPLLAALVKAAYASGR